MPSYPVINRRNISPLVRKTLLVSEEAMERINGIGAELHVSQGSADAISPLPQRRVRSMVWWYAMRRLLAATSVSGRTKFGDDPLQPGGRKGRVVAPCDGSIADVAGLGHEHGAHAEGKVLDSGRRT